MPLAFPEQQDRSVSKKISLVMVMKEEGRPDDLSRR